jgi:catechol 2,3-dioxygenase-like lactoylglutathione lyase family enzyme
MPSSSAGRPTKCRVGWSAGRCPRRRERAHSLTEYAPTPNGCYGTRAGSKRSAASVTRPSRRCEYRFRVISGFAWPATAWTSLTSAPAATRRETQVCRRSWTPRRRGRPVGAPGPRRAAEVRRLERRPTRRREHELLGRVASPLYRPGGQLPEGALHRREERHGANTGFRLRRPQLLGARGRSGGHCDDANSGRQRTTRADEVPLAVKPGRQPVRAGKHPGIRHVAFAVEDIDAVVAGLRARGAELVGELERYKDITGSATSAARRESSSS